MLVSECMTDQVELGRPDMTIQEAAQKMRDGDFGALPIGENDRLVGIVTDRDITIRATAAGKEPSRTLVREVMSPHVRYCFEDQTVEEVTQELGDNQVRRVPVLNRNKRLVGILSLGDLAQSEADPIKVEQALSRISETKNRGSEFRI